LPGKAMKNVILITLDTLRQDALGCYGQNKLLTPFIDSLQSKCLKFTTHQATGPYTQASFPGILTSSYFLDHGVPGKLSVQRTLISEPLKHAGITTVAFHSNPYLCGFLGWNRGWDKFYDSMEEEVSPESPFIKGDVLNKKVNGWLSTQYLPVSAKRLFLWVHYMDAHEPYMPPQKYIDLVDPAIKLAPEEMFKLFLDVLKRRDATDKTKVALLRKLYEARVREVDDHIRELFGLLNKYHLLDDSSIIITSDHGDEFGEHGGLSHDDKMYGELINTPLLIYDSRRETGETCDLVVSNVDIPPTIVSLFGLDPENNFQGHSLLPLENYPCNGCFGEALDQRSKRGGDIDKDVYFYRQNDLKIIYRANLDQWEMYDLKSDPKELNNIIDSSSDASWLKNKLKPRVKRWQNKPL